MEGNIFLCEQNFVGRDYDVSFDYMGISIWWRVRSNSLSNFCK